MKVSALRFAAFLAVTSLTPAVSQDDFPPSRYPFAHLMDVSEIPQFITITFDDGVAPSTINPIREFVLDVEDSRGCTPPFTYFVSFDNTICELVQGLRRGGHELATHTLRHTGYPTEENIEDAIIFMNETCGIPKDEIKGFRTPYLAYDQDTLNHLSNIDDVLYDTTITADDHVQANYGRENIWPFTWEHAEDTDIACKCDKNLALPGLWEIPMYPYFDSSDNRIWGLMDYDNVADSIQQNLERRYTGNRAPFGIYLHAQWLEKDGNGAFLKTWIQATLNNYDDVFFVRNQELLDWMKNPVPLSEYRQNSCEGQVSDCFPSSPNTDAPTYSCP
jgi:hypothetical protein